MDKTFLRNSLRREALQESQIVKNNSVTLTASIQLKFKKIFEIILSLFTLISIGIWLFPLIGILIKASSKGPVIFKQLRHGKDNIPFYCYKFRTMVINDDADILQATKGDSRITRCGAFLRKSSLDELPQLINVLKGEMSLVGPRPHAIPMNEIFSKEIPGYMYRHTMKPGLTGLAQSKGSRGEIQDYHDLNFRYRMDMFYIRNWNLIFDFKIIVWTVYSLFFDNKKAY